MSVRWRSAQPTRAVSESCSSRAISVAVYSTFGGTVGDSNVIAGLAHDHLFVGWEQGERARALLSEL